jgi:hypothetical protein
VRRPNALRVRARSRRFSTPCRREGRSHHSSRLPFGSVEADRRSANRAGDPPLPTAVPLRWSTGTSCHMCSLEHDIRAFKHLKRTSQPVQYLVRFGPDRRRSAEATQTAGPGPQR